MDEVKLKEALEQISEYIRLLEPQERNHLALEAVWDMADAALLRINPCGEPEMVRLLRWLRDRIDYNRRRGAAQDSIRLSRMDEDEHIILFIEDQFGYKLEEDGTWTSEEA